MTTNVFDEIQPQSLTEHMNRAAMVTKMWAAMFPAFTAPADKIMEWVLTYPDKPILKAFRRTLSKTRRFDFTQDDIERYAASIMRHEVKNEHQFLTAPDTQSGQFESTTYGNTGSL